jgi:DNA-binding transcriptional regulator GbsR (MarR family)
MPADYNMPIDAAEFDAHKDVGTIVTQFLCRNSDKGYSAREIAQATGLSEANVNSSMLKLGLSDLVSSIAGKRKKFQIEDVTINGITYYRCVSQ